MSQLVDASSKQLLHGNNSSLACRALNIVFQHVWVPKLGWDFKIFEERLPAANEIIIDKHLELLKKKSTGVKFNGDEERTKLLALFNQPTGYFSDEFLNEMKNGAETFEVEDAWFDRYRQMKVCNYYYPSG
jgi:hypothetical protein